MQAKLYGNIEYICILDYYSLLISSYQQTMMFFRTGLHFLVTTEEMLPI